MHISTTKIAFSLEEIFNYLQLKDPLVFGKVNDLICDYAEELYKNYPGTRLPCSPVKEGIQFKPCGAPIFFETTPTHDSQIATTQVKRRLDFN